MHIITISNSHLFRGVGGGKSIIKGTIIFFYFNCSLSYAIKSFFKGCFVLLFLNICNQVGNRKGSHNTYNCYNKQNFRKSKTPMGVVIARKSAGLTKQSQNFTDYEIAALPLVARNDIWYYAWCKVVFMPKLSVCLCICFALKTIIYLL